MDSKKEPSGILIYFVVLFAWLIPGGGHCMQGRWERGMIMFFTICSTFFMGIMLGGVEMVDSRVPWFYAQIITGAPAIIATLIQNPHISAMDIYGRGVDLGQVYAGVAGLLNLLCIFDALMLNRSEPSAGTGSK